MSYFNSTHTSKGIYDIMDFVRDEIKQINWRN